LENISEKHNIELDVLKKFDEQPKKRLFSRTEKGLSNSLEHNVAQVQFQYLQDKAAAGESFVIVGRCAETILKEYKGLISIFVHADLEMRLKRTMESLEVSEKKAQMVIRENDARRKQYHNSYSDHKWGRAKGYDITISSSVLGIDGTVEILKKYIDARKEYTL
jgi:cytidylate kinase